MKQIAEGGFGNIYRAKHREWGTVVYKELKSTFIAEGSKLVILKMFLLVRFYVEQNLYV